MLENVKLALEALWNHKLRSLLTMLGIIIGIAAIIAIFCMINGNTAKIKQEIIGNGNNSIDVFFGSKSIFNRSVRKQKEEFPAFVPEINEQEIKKLTHAPEISQATLFHKQMLRIFHQSLNVSAEVQAVADQYFKITPQKLLKGRNFAASDYIGQKQVVLLEEQVYQQLFPKDNGLEQFVELNGVPFKVIGVVSDPKKQSEFSEKQAYIPVNNWPVLSNKVNPEPYVRIQTKRTEELERIGKQVANYLNQKLPQSDYAFGINDFSEYAKNQEELEKANFMLLAGVASISLLVGGIGVMNIMLVSVTERTSEIGLKKAIGARKSVILLQFLTESITLAVIGGMIGILLGLAIGYYTTQIMGSPFVLSMYSIVGSLLFSCSVGIIFGLLPAMKAARLSPITALKFD